MAEEKRFDIDLSLYTIEIPFEDRSDDGKPFQTTRTITVDPKFELKSSLVNSRAGGDRPGQGPDKFSFVEFLPIVMRIEEMDGKATTLTVTEDDLEKIRTRMEQIANKHFGYREARMMHRLRKPKERMVKVT